MLVLIRSENITKIYHSEAGDVVAANNISLNFSCNGLYMILGTSGCGKTTLLNMLSGLDSYDNGRIYIGDTDISEYTEVQLDDYRNLKMGIVFQEFNLISELSVYDNLKIVLEIQEWEGKEKHIVDALVDECLQKVGLDGYQYRKINELSGGERQRVAIARTIIKKPNILFADEPTGNLDFKTSESVFELLKELSREYVVIVVTHDYEAAYQYADTVIHMKNGEVTNIDCVQKGKQQEIYSFSYTTGKIVKTASGLKYENLGDFFSEILRNTNPEQEIIINNIKKQKNETEEKKKKPEEKHVEKKAKKISRRYQLRLAFSFLKKKKVTLFLTMCILAISSVLFYMSIYSVSYRKQDTIINYFHKYQPEILPVYYAASHTDSFYRQHTEMVTNGKYFATMLNKSIPDGIVKLECRSDLECYKIGKEGYAEDGIDGVTMFFISPNYNNLVFVSGRRPEKPKETVITDYLANSLGVELGDKILAYNQELEVCGITKTDYIEYKLKPKIIYGSESPFFEYDLKYRYGVIFCTDSLLHETLDKSNYPIGLAYSDFTASDKEISYGNRNLRYSSIRNIGVINLVSGRLPESNDEVIVSESYAEEHGLLDDSGTLSNEKFYFKDIYNQSDNAYFSAHMNLCSLFPDGVRVVGVVSPFEVNFADADIYVNETQWGKLASEYYDNFFASIVYSVDDTGYNTFVENVLEIGANIDEPAVRQIDDFSDTLFTLRPFLIFLVLLTLTLNVFMLSNFVHISIRNNRKNIGVLRSLGVGNSDVKKIFTFEAWIIYIVSFALSIPLIAFVQHIANDVYADNLIERTYDIVMWNLNVFGVVLVVEFIANYVILKLLMKRFHRMKIMDLIR